MAFRISKLFMVILCAVLLVGAAGCGNQALEQSKSTEQPEVFPSFQGTDLSGQKIDQTMFQDHAVTVLNFWFNECPACVEEIPELEALNQELLKKDAVLIGVNVEFPQGDEVVQEAEAILEEKGGHYTNIGIQTDSEAQSYISTINAFPTFIVVDREGKIVGEPIVGALLKGSPSREILTQRIEEVIAKDQKA